MQSIRKEVKTADVDEQQGFIEKTKLKVLPRQELKTANGTKMCKPTDKKEKQEQRTTYKHTHTHALRFLQVCGMPFPFQLCWSVLRRTAVN